MLAPPRTVVRREGGLYALERALQRRGFTHVAGADEAGRGACAGPLVAGAAILPEGKRGEIEELADSKLLTPAARERVYEQVVKRALAWSVVIVPPAEVDARGLHVCNLAAMRRALASLSTRPDYVLTDGFPVDGLGAPGLAVWKGDRVAACVAAASVLAKVTRDRLMVELDGHYPHYGFAVHKGYITDEHSAALTAHGPCVEHRFSYVNVAAASGRGNRPPRARRPASGVTPGSSAGSAEPLMLWPELEGTVGVASGEQPRPPVPVGEDEAMEGEKR
ncbi:ribonuclease HII [Pseudosporangium ferrugineum]|uniref:Ribonuclease HII n=1 Tax=Pseudosporangium ferrugineum TaxID=439699 RepID=A0A2T0SCL3_9ACTN|nr:ribonuclease HII [Pseudosporangium ferrugineum]PRY31158.1 RNase HII [Pseudosporangium ferrugineum]